MDLADLLAREGYADTDLTRLLAWARARADALLAEADVPAPLRGLLHGDSEHVPEDMPRAPASRAASAPAPVPASEEDIPIDLRRAVTAATAPHPAAVEVDDDAESGIGGFARFGGIGRFKNQPYPFRQQSEPEDRPTIARSFALAAEKAAEERDTPVVAKPAAPAAAPPAELSGTLPMAALGISAEESGGLVLGIPDDDAADVPVSRASTPSAGVPRASGPQRSSGALVDDDDDAAPLRSGALVDDDDDAAPLRSGALVDDDDDAPPRNPLAVADDDDLTGDALGGLIEATDSELLAVSDVLSEAPGDGAPLPPPPEPVHPVISEPSGVDLSRPITARETNPVLHATREQTGPRDAHVDDVHDDPHAPVLRRRTPKKKVVELGAPVGRPRGGSGGAVTPKSSPHGPRKSPPPPPPPPGRRPTPRHEEIEELSRVEVLEDLPAYLRDDEE